MKIFQKDGKFTIECEKAAREKPRDQYNADDLAKDLIKKTDEDEIAWDTDSYDHATIIGGTNICLFGDGVWVGLKSSSFLHLSWCKSHYKYRVPLKWLDRLKLKQAIKRQYRRRAQAGRGEAASLVQQELMKLGDALHR